MGSVGSTESVGEKNIYPHHYHPGPPLSGLKAKSSDNTLDVSMGVVVHCHGRAL